MTDREKLMAEILEGLDRLGKEIDKGTNVLTNADRIRAMSDEELAEFLCDRTENCNLGYCPGADLCNCVDGKANGYLKWLKQPAEGE